MSPASRRGKERLLRRRGQRVDRHFGTRIRDREPAVLLGAKWAPALQHALELLALRRLLIQHLFERGAQRAQLFRPWPQVRAMKSLPETSASAWPDHLLA